MFAEPAQDRAPTSVAENIDKMAQVESDALRPRSHREAITEAIGGFAGTIYFVVLQLAVFGGWLVVNAGMVPGLSAFDPPSYPLLSSITSLEAVLLAVFVLNKQNRMSTIAGGSLVVARVPDDRAASAEAVLDRSAVNIRDRAAIWEKQGWTRFDPKAPPYTSDEIRREREMYRTRV
jgi:hypothetical protein